MCIFVEKYFPMLKKLFFLGFTFICLSLSAQKSMGYKMDILGHDYLCKTIQMPNDYEGQVVVSLVKYYPEDGRKMHSAVLYVHGYNDYFFQEEMARRFHEQGIAFYAVDLRKYGRSYRPNQTLFEVRKMSEYFADIDTVLGVMRSEGQTSIFLMGHSTGGLILSLYAKAHQDHLPVQGLILNSPFLDMNLSPFMEGFVTPVSSFFAPLFRKAKVGAGMSSAYAESLLKAYHGEWSFDVEMKRVFSAPITLSWIRAIHKGHKEIQKGADIPCPILLMYSDNSVTEQKWTLAHQKGDAVLDVKDIQKYGRRLGPQVTEAEIAGGLHDLVLSEKETREKVYQAMFQWIQKVQPSNTSKQ